MSKLSHLFRTVGRVLAAAAVGAAIAAPSASADVPHVAVWINGPAASAGPGAPQRRFPLDAGPAASYARRDPNQPGV
jgi:hypothetical protein